VPYRESCRVAGREGRHSAGADSPRSTLLCSTYTDSQIRGANVADVNVSSSNCSSGEKQSESTVCFIG
jgi:hypothetical protein